MDGSTFGNFNNGTSFIGSTLALSSISSVHEEVTWYDTICPDQTNSNDNGNTCENNLQHTNRPTDNSLIQHDSQGTHAIIPERKWAVAIKI